MRNDKELQVNATKALYRFILTEGISADTLKYRIRDYLDFMSLYGPSRDELFRANKLLEILEKHL